MSHAETVGGITEVWGETLGDPEVCIAVLDGPVALAHPCFKGASLTQTECLVARSEPAGHATKHGTYVGSIIFGQHDGPVDGLAPRCRGIVIPIFGDDQGLGAACSQLNVAQGILQALGAGADIINISAGQLSPSGAAHPLLADAVRTCASANVLVVAATGNDGCACLHVPGSLPSVLAVGAMTSRGLPLQSSNWSGPYDTQGILAPGEDILGADADGGVVLRSGTSSATAIVSGVAALLLSLQIKSGRKKRPHAIRDLILSTGVRCRAPEFQCERKLAGRLDVRAAVSQLRKEVSTVSIRMGTQDEVHVSTDEPTTQTPGDVADQLPIANRAAAIGAAVAAQSVSTALDTRAQGKLPTTPAGDAPGSVRPSCGCSSGEECSCGTSPLQKVFAVGTVTHTFVSEQRRQSIAQHMATPDTPNPNPSDVDQLATYLDEHPWEAASVLWTLSLDAVVIYAIQPFGPFANEGYVRLRQFLREQRTEGVERVSVPGIIAGKVTLLSGQTVPVIVPELRCMYSWTTSALVKAAGGKKVPGGKHDAVVNFLERIYALRDLGITSQGRAINFAATNALTAAGIFESALMDGMQLDTIEVEPSPVCPPDADCWDVRLVFFDPEKQTQRARRAYLFTIDVTDVCPLMLGKVRSWSVR